jgi:hypothetical protein
MADVNILVNIWNYFASSPTEPVKNEVIKQETPSQIGPKVRKLKNIFENIEFDESDIKMFEEQDKLAEKKLLEDKLYIQKLNSDDHKYEESKKAADIFESEMILLKSIHDLTSDILYPEEINTETYENYSISNYNESLHELFQSGIIPTLIKGKGRYLNLYECALYLKPNIIPKVNTLDVKIKNYYGIHNHKIKNIISLALTLGININIYTNNNKIQIITAVGGEILNYFYHSQVYYPLINITSLSNQDFIRLDSNNFLTSTTQITIYN